jgi:hypothetical protein
MTTNEFSAANRLAGLYFDDITDAFGREPATLRTQVLTCGAILGRTGRRLVLHLSETWGGLKTRSSFFDNILRWQIPTSPKFNSVIAT